MMDFFTSTTGGDAEQRRHHLRLSDQRFLRQPARPPVLPPPVATTAPSTSPRGVPFRWLLHQPTSSSAGQPTAKPGRRQPASLWRPITSALDKLPPQQSPLIATSTAPRPHLLLNPHQAGSPRAASWPSAAPTVHRHHPRQGNENGPRSKYHSRLHGGRLVSTSYGKAFGVESPRPLENANPAMFTPSLGSEVEAPTSSFSNHPPGTRGPRPNGAKPTRPID